MDGNVDPEQDKADLVIWLKAYDLQQLHSTLVEFGYDKLSVCTLLDETTLEEMGIPNRAHRETLLTAVNDLRQLDCDVDEYDDGWSSQEEDNSATPDKPANNGVQSDEEGALMSTSRFLSGLDSGKLEESYRQSFIGDEPEDIDGDNIDDLPLPPPPPPIPAQRSGEPQYADIPILAPPPPPANVEDDMEKHATSSFLASLGGSFGGFLGEDELLDEADGGPPVAPKPKVRLSPKPSTRDANSALPPVPPAVSTSVGSPPDSKPAAAPRKPKPPPPERSETTSVSPPLAVSVSPSAPSPKPKPAVAQKATLTAPVVSAPHDVYASVNKPTSPPPVGVDLPPIQPVSNAPAPKPKPVSKPKPAKGVTIVEPEKSVLEKQNSASKFKDPKDRRSLVDIQGGDVDLDALLADLLEMENNVGSTSASPVKKGTAPAPVAKPAAAPMDEDEFTKLMAEMDLMGGGSSSSQPAPQRKVGDRKSAADLHGEISKLSGGAKVIAPVPVEDLSTSVLPPGSLLGQDQHLSVEASGSVDDDLEALSRDLDSPQQPMPSMSSRLSGSFVSSMFGSPGGDPRRPSDTPSADDLRPAPSSVPNSSRPSLASLGTVPRATPSPSGNGYGDVREVRNTAIVKLPEKEKSGEGRLEQELYQLEHGLPDMSEVDRKSRMEAVKVQIAVEKLKEAKVKKVVLKAYNADKSSKMIVIDDKMSSREICSRLMKKNRVQPGPNYILAEQLTELYVERRLEDHEMVVPVLDSWPRESNNSIVFVSKPDKYMLLKRPQLFMPPSHAYAPGQRTGVLESTKRDIILKELFVAQTLPEIEGFLMFKEGKKGSWKKQYFSLRKSGLYYSTKGKAVAMKDLHRMAEWKDIDVYTPINSVYHKRYKAPTDHCFALKPSGPLDIFERKMRHFAVDSKQEQNAWIQGIRLAKLGNQLLEDYEKTYQQMPWLSRETEEEIDGIIKLQEQQGGEEDDKRARTGTLGKLRKGTLSKKQHETAAADLAARSEMVTSSGSPVGSRPLSSASLDSTDGELTTWQKQFGRAWKTAADDNDETGDVKRINMDDLPPTPRTTATPYTSEFAPGEEDGMFNVRLF